MSNERPIRFSISRLVRRRLPEPITEPALEALARWRAWREVGQVDLAKTQGQLKGESIYPSLLSAIKRARKEVE